MQTAFTTNFRILNSQEREAFCGLIYRHHLWNNSRCAVCGQKATLDEWLATGHGESRQVQRDLKGNKCTTLPLFLKDGTDHYMRIYAVPKWMRAELRERLNALEAQICLLRNDLDTGG